MNGSHLNCYSDGFFLDEIEAFEEAILPERLEELKAEDKLEHGDATLARRDFTFGRLDNYLTVNVCNTPFALYTAKVKGEGLWMSITPMEVQSNYVAIQRALGAEGERVAFLGLSLGYVPVRFMQLCEAFRQPGSVHIYEKSQDLVDLFIANFGHHKNFNIFEFHVGDARETFRGREYGFVYSDIYQSIFDDAVGDDIDLFCSNNEIREYRFWTQEGFIYYLGADQDTADRLVDSGVWTWDDTMFLQHFYNSYASDLKPVAELPTSACWDITERLIYWNQPAEQRKEKVA